MGYQPRALNLIAVLPCSQEPYLFSCSGGFLGKGRDEENNRKVRWFLVQIQQQLLWAGLTELPTGSLQATQGFVQTFIYSAVKLISCIKLDGISQHITECQCLGKAHVSVCQTLSHFPGFLPPKFLLSLFLPDYTRVGISNICSWNCHHTDKTNKALT